MERAMGAAWNSSVRRARCAARRSAGMAMARLELHLEAERGEENHPGQRAVRAQHAHAAQGVAAGDLGDDEHPAVADLEAGGGADEVGVDGVGELEVEAGEEGGLLGGGDEVLVHLGAAGDVLGGAVDAYVLAPLVADVDGDLDVPAGEIAQVDEFERVEDGAGEEI